jgi:hypothetical protein
MEIELNKPFRYGHINPREIKSFGGWFLFPMQYETTWILCKAGVVVYIKEEELKTDFMRNANDSIHDMLALFINHLNRTGV